MTTARKKMINIYILDILRKHSNVDHPLSQAEIAKLLKDSYGIVADRKAIKRNIDDLIDAGYEIAYDDSVKRNIRNSKTGEYEESTISTKFYLMPYFDDGMLRLLIDGVLCSRYIHAPQRKDLIAKLEGLTSKFFCSRVSHIQTVTDPVERNQDVFMIIEDLDKAITNCKKVSFQCRTYKTDKLLHAKTDRNGEIIDYVVNPVQIVMANGWYYLVGNLDQHEDLSSFRLDKIKGLEVLDESAKPNSEIKGAERVINPVKYSAEHIFMYNGKPEVVTFQANKRILDEIMDRFGSSASFINETESTVEVRVTTDLKAMRYWAVQYATNMRVLYPQSLADLVKADLQTALDNYL